MIGTLLIGFLLLLLPPVLWSIAKQVYSYYRKCRAVRNIPGFPTHWLWGNLHQIKLEEAFLNELKDFVCKNRYKVTKVWIGPFSPRVSVNHSELVGKLMKEPKYDVAYNLLRPWLGDGLLLSQGKKWFRNRRLLTPAFHYEILKPYIDVYNSCLGIMLQKWTISANKTEPVKVFEAIKSLSLDILMQCVFSFKSNCQHEGQKHPYLQAVCDIIDLTSARAMTLHHRVDWIYYFSANGRKYRKACKIVHDYSEMVIKERRNALKVNQESSDKRKYLDFLDILLTAADEDGNGLTDLEIRDEADTFMFEGHDTTTSGISWTLYCLAKYPEHQEKIREEVRNVLMGREWLDYDDLKELKYTQWCIKEAMRLYPPVFFIMRRLSSDTELDGHLIPKGMPINISIRIIHRNPDIWENPEEYDPLRFHPSNAEGRDPYAYLPFSAGQRNCIGQNFALNEEKLVVGSIVHRFNLSLVEGHKVEMCPTIVLRTMDDILVNITPL
jgi:cytochrome P450